MVPAFILATLCVGVARAANEVPQATAFLTRVSPDARMTREGNMSERRSSVYFNMSSKRMFFADGNRSDGKRTSWTIEGPPPETRPDYEHIHGPLGKFLDDIFMALFRTRLAERVGVDSNLPKVGCIGDCDLSLIY
mmetsp:Transcript_49398/g.148828  ORF Transcript_49398/g.148828 Transcript_49398/m.148828 type:complete len:136 (+) Transcript_49398:104-511(+)